VDCSRVSFKVSSAFLAPAMVLAPSYGTNVSANFLLNNGPKTPGSRRFYTPVQRPQIRSPVVEQFLGDEP